MKMAIWLTLTACLLLPFTVTVADIQRATFAGNEKNIAEKSPSLNQLNIESREQAVQLVKRQYQGKVLKVKSSRVNGHPGYQIKLLSKEGRVFYVSVDAQTGRVSRN